MRAQLIFSVYFQNIIKGISEILGFIFGGLFVGPFLFKAIYKSFPVGQGGRYIAIQSRQRALTRIAVIARLPPGAIHRTSPRFAVLVFAYFVFVFCLVFVFV